MACGVRGTTLEIRAELSPLASCKSATARRRTRTCCTPPRNTFFNALWSFGLTLMLRAGRGIPQVCAKTFLIGSVLLEFLQAVENLAYGVTSNNPHYGPVRNPWR